LATGKETNQIPDTRKSCFVISPIGEDLSETRKRADQVLKHLVRPAVEACGYKATRADEIDKPGLITSQVIQAVVNDDLVIADLSETNPNVFYELAVRHVIRKPLIQIIQKGERIPFDVGGMRTISFDHQDLDSVAEAKENIIKQIRELEENPSEMETPISISIELQKLRQSDDPDDRNYADLLAAVSDVRGDVQAIGLKAEEIGEVAARAVTRRLSEMSGIRPSFMSRKIHPGMIMEMTHNIGDGPEDPIQLLIHASFFRDEIPWLYELALEAYRGIRSGSSSASHSAYQRYRDAIHSLRRGPFMDIYGRDNKMMHMMLMDSIEFLPNFDFAWKDDEKVSVRSRGVIKKS
jgi:hypothetical protein